MGYVDFRVRQAFVTATQRACRHERANARVYRALAAHMSDTSHRIVLLKLADAADHCAARHATRLRGLGAGLPPEGDTWGERFWRWLLMRLGTRWALVWADWVQYNDTEWLTFLVEWEVRRLGTHPRPS